MSQEELPLRKLSQQAETSLAKGLIQNVADLPLSVVVGRPRLAISYIAFNGQVPATALISSYPMSLTSVPA